MAKTKRYQPEQLAVLINQTIEQLISEAIEAEEGLRSDIRVQDIAQRFCVDVATLRRWCNESFGISPKLYLANYRINKAKTLLKQGVRASITSESLGFTEHKVFSTLFKRHAELSPSDYQLREK